MTARCQQRSCPKMNYEGKGAVDTHNKSSTAHKELFDQKLDKLTGKGQFAGFTEDNVVGAVDAPQVAKATPALVSCRTPRWRSARSPTRARDGIPTISARRLRSVPQVTCQAEDFDGVVLIKDITAEDSPSTVCASWQRAATTPAARPAPIHRTKRPHWSAAQRPQLTQLKSITLP